MSDTKELFANCLFKVFAPAETEAFLRRCQEKTYPDGATLFNEQDESTTLYMILSGEIKLHFEMSQRENVDTTISSLKPGEAVGWSAIVPPHNYRLSGYCKGKTTLLEIDRETLKVLFETNYHVGLHLHAQHRRSNR